MTLGCVDKLSEIMPQVLLQTKQESKKCSEDGICWSFVGHWRFSMWFVPPKTTIRAICLCRVQERIKCIKDIQVGLYDNVHGKACTD